jgi:hypothetical protein
MKSYVALAAGIGLGMLIASTPSTARLVQPLAAQGAQHEQHHPGAAAAPDTIATAQKDGMRGNMMMGNMMASDAKLDELVKKMNEAKGSAKTDAIAEVVNALVEQHRAMHGMMAGKMGEMKAAPAQPGK